MTRAILAAIVVAVILAVATRFDLEVPSTNGGTVIAWRIDRWTGNVCRALVTGDPEEHRIVLRCAR
jgi:hypothetical protein